MPGKTLRSTASVALKVTSSVRTASPAWSSGLRHRSSHSAAGSHRPGSARPHRTVSPTVIWSQSWRAQLLCCWAGLAATGCSPAPACTTQHGLHSTMITYRPQTLATNDDFKLRYTTNLFLAHSPELVAHIFSGRLILAVVHLVSSPHRKWIPLRSGKTGQPCEALKGSRAHISEGQGLAGVHMTLGRVLDLPKTGLCRVHHTCSAGLIGQVSLALHEGAVPRIVLFRKRHCVDLPTHRN